LREVPVWATSDGPRIEDFGITREDLARAPCSFIANHRPKLLVGAYLLTAGVVFVTILRAGDSWSAAVFFAVVGLAAGSILLLPLLMLALCATQVAEEHWLCRRFPRLRACLAYQKAVAEHERRTAVQTPSPVGEIEWAALSEPVFLEEVASLLEQRHPSAVSRMQRESSGLDFVIDDGVREILVRCESGSIPVAASVGREMAAALADRGARRAFIISGAKATPLLADYIADRAIEVIAPWNLDSHTRSE
jgi:hypothetical protein